MSTQRLDRTQESFDLTRAIFAGFVKLRFWGTAARLQLHAVVGAIILFGTVLFLALSLGILFLQHRLSTATPEFFLATLGPLGFGYVLHQNMRLLRQVWKSIWGKLSYLLVSSLIIVFCKIVTDLEILELTRSHPSLFSSAREAIILFNIIQMTVIGIGGLLLLSASLQLYIGYFTGYGRLFLWCFSLTGMLGLSKKPFNFRSEARFFAKLWGGFFCLAIVIFVQFGFAEIRGKPFDITEALLVWSSFIPNDRGFAGSDRVCVNLPSDTLVYPFSTKDPTPDQVIMAKPIGTNPDRSGQSYTYHVVPCSKPTGPGASLGTDHR